MQYNSVSETKKGSPEQIEAAKEEVKKYHLPLKVTSWILNILGGYGIFCCITGLFCARRFSSYTIEKYTAPSPYMKLDQYTMIDNIRSGSFLWLLAAIFIFVTGCKGLEAIKTSTSVFAARVFKMSIVRIVIGTIFTLIGLQYIHDITVISKRLKKQSSPPSDLPQESSEEWGRNLMNQTFENATNSCTGLAQSTCSSNSQCSWCKCSAVPSSCFAVADAKKLPPSIFACDNLPKKPFQYKYDKYDKNPPYCPRVPFTFFLIAVLAGQVFLVKKLQDSLTALEDLDKIEEAPRNVNYQYVEHNQVAQSSPTNGTGNAIN